MSNRDKKINEENLAEKPTPKSYRKLLVWLSSVLLFLMVIQTGFYFFAKPMLKGYVEKKVNAVTQGLYTVNFDDIKVNVAGQSLFITDFELVPDTILYRKLINKENYSKSLFNIKLDSLVIRKVRLLNLFGDKREFKIEEIGLRTPQITIVANPSE
ncbi:MAG: hypothetical protein U9N85_08670, partial [Bacteroidota bacterium]|nr:hypothetical protein [Bacteroidota bacterium]